MISFNNAATLYACLKTESLPLPDQNQWSIAISFTGHDGSVTIAKGREVIEVIELERFFNSKNFDFTCRLWKDYTKNDLLYLEKTMANFYLNELSNYISRKYTNKFDYGIIVQRDFIPLYENQERFKFLEYFNIDEVFYYSHHMAHASGVFYQSPYKKSLVISFDGGSPDGSLNIFIYDRNKDNPKFICQIDESLGKEYPRFGNIFKDIKYTIFNASLVQPGKIMGLAGYGNPLYEYMYAFKKIYVDNCDNRRQKFSEFLKVINKDEQYYNKFFHVKYNVREKYTIEDSDRLTGQLQYDVAATVQKAFEECFLELIMPILFEYPDLPVCISGGCALNIILNTRLVEQYGLEVFVSPNPTDCGLSFGAMMALLRPETACDNPYLGTELLDRDLLTTYIYENVGLTNNDYIVISEIDKKLEILAKYITEGKIIGIARGRSEIGPRALGNRSIVCSVAIPDMKDKINSKVKGREWFRPFAPVVRLESVNKFFHWNKETRYMSFCPKVREEYVDKIKPIVHVDGTARVQTITREQNEFIYNLLTEMEKQSGYDMLLNTSFNVDGKPIISSIKDAFDVMLNTKLDGIVIDNVMILKNHNLES
jgi:carbamoyltransferase